MTKASRVIILAEDTTHQRFVRRYLYRLGFSTHQLDVRQMANGRGSGEQWVRRHYANAVRDYRVRSSKARTALIVITDADAGDISRRAKQLQEALKQARTPARSDAEAIAHLIPRRNIETWILHLNGLTVDEETDYSGRGTEDLISNAAAAFYEWTKQPPPECLPSLKSAFQETRRIR